MPSVVHRFAFTDFNGRNHEKLFSTADLFDGIKVPVIINVAVWLQLFGSITRDISTDLFLPTRIDSM
jgi:hypothetical protein